MCFICSFVVLFISITVVTDFCQSSKKYISIHSDVNIRSSNFTLFPCILWLLRWLSHSHLMIYSEGCYWFMSLFPEIIFLVLECNYLLLNGLSLRLCCTVLGSILPSGFSVRVAMYGRIMFVIHSFSIVFYLSHWTDTYKKLFLHKSINYSPYIHPKFSFAFLVRRFTLRLASPYKI